MSFRGVLGMTTVLGLTALLAACASCGPPSGRDEGRGPPGRGGPPDMAMSRGPGSGSAGRPADASAAQLLSARTQLKLGPPQVAAWNAYEDSIRALLDDLSRSASDGSGSAVQRVDRRVDLARNRYAALESVADAMRVLYAQLDGEQRLMADRVLPGTVPSLAPYTAAFDIDYSEPGPGGGRQRPQRRPGPM